MRTATKVCLIVAASLVLLGALIVTVTMTILNWDFFKLGTTKNQTNTHELTEEFRDISLRTNTADIALLPSADGTAKVVCYETEKMKHTVTVTDGTLTVELVDTRKWYDHIGIFSVDHAMVTVYLPSGDYGALTIDENTGDVGIPKDFSFETATLSLHTGDVTFDASVSEALTIKTTTGDIRVSGITAGSLALSVSTGDIDVGLVTCVGDTSITVSTGKARLADLSCKSFSSTGNTGDLALTNVIAEERIVIERSTGDVTLDGCDAAELSITTDTGDVTGSLLSEKIFFATTDTGKTDVPQTMSGGKCEITTDTGDIRITLR